MLGGAKRSGVTKWKCWKTWEKVTKAVIGCPSECQKQRVFQGGTPFSPKGGVAGGVKNARFSGKTRFKVVKPGPFRAHFGPNRASFGAFSAFSSNPCAKAVQNDHMEPISGDRTCSTPTSLFPPRLVRPNPSQRLRVAGFFHEWSQVLHGFQRSGAGDWIAIEHSVNESGEIGRRVGTEFLDPARPFAGEHFEHLGDARLAQGKEDGR